MSDTIVALSTPPGIGGIAVVRLSGDTAISIAGSCFRGKQPLSEYKSHTIHHGNFVFEESIIDNITVAIFKSPMSYTGEDVIEFNCHGGMLVADEIISALIKSGARQAEPGEFTKRAFLNAKLDLTQVEAVADIIHSSSVPGLRTAARQLNGEFTSRFNIIRQKLLDTAGLLEIEIDFTDEGLEFTDRSEIRKNLIETRDFCTTLSDSFKSAEVLRSGYFVGIAGYPNSGKSTLFNHLLQRKRAIVSEIPGTTRDYIEETLFINGLSIKLIDTAGIRDTEDVIEIEGIKFVESILEQSNMILVINDLQNNHNNSNPLLDRIRASYPEAEVVLIQNKIDIANLENYTSTDDTLYISAKKDIGLDELKSLLFRNATKSVERIQDILVNQRQAQLLKQAAGSLQNAINALDANAENELITIDIRMASRQMGEITGESWNKDVLNNIFARFCIGK